MVLKEILAVYDDVVVKYIYLKHNNKTATRKMINNKISCLVLSYKFFQQILQSAHECYTYDFN